MIIKISLGSITAVSYTHLDVYKRQALASIENGARGLAFASGLAATDCLLRMFKAGDEIIAMDDLYGGTYRLFTRLYKDSGIKFHFVDMNDFCLLYTSRCV